MQPIYFFFFSLNVRQTGVKLKERLATTCFEWLPPSHSDTETGRIEQPISHRGDTAANEKTFWILLLRSACCVHQWSINACFNAANKINGIKTWILMMEANLNVFMNETRVCKNVLGEKNSKKLVSSTCLLKVKWFANFVEKNNTSCDIVF